MSEYPPPYQQQTGSAGAYPPPQKYPPPQQQPANVVVVQQPVAVQQSIRFGLSPVTYVDSNGNQVQTVLEYRTGLLTWIVVGIMFLFGLWCCACIPCCIDGLKDVYHINPTNGQVVGVYQRLS